MLVRGCAATQERICNPCFEREIILVRLYLKSNSWYFAISNELAKPRYSELKLFQTERIIIIQVRGERSRVKIGWK